jgi:alginate O-acetyltransferase complex protein AlgI
MSLASVGFAIFLPIVFALYWLLPRRAAVQNTVLLLASAVFYATWNVRLLPLLAAAILIDWALSHALAARHGWARKGLLALGIALDLAVLALFKYEGFFADSLNALLTACGLPESLPVLQLALPLGISYTTLVRIGYMLDVYYGRREPEPSLLRFALFVGFFAHLIAGPVVRAQAMLSQYATPRRLTPDGLTQAATTFLLG